MSFEEYESLNKQKKKDSKTKWISCSLSLTTRYMMILSKRQFCLSRQFEGCLNTVPGRREAKLLCTAISAVVFHYETDAFPILVIT